MDGQPFRALAKEASLTPKALASIAHKPVNPISRQLRDNFGQMPRYLIVLILAWEAMAADQRVDWMKQLERERLG